MRRLSLLLVLVAGFGLPPGPANADTLVLKNGDTISGEFVRHTDGMIVFHSDTLGQLQVPADAATVTQTTASAGVAVPPAASNRFASIARIDSSEDRRSNRDADNHRWRRRLDFGLTAQDGLHDQSNYNLRFEVARAAENGELNFAFARRYSKVDGRLLNDATNATVLLTHNVTEDLFLRGQTRYDRDPAAQVGQNAEQSLGLGYTVVESDRLKLDVGGGAALRYRDAYGNPASWNGLLDAFGRLRFAVTERVSLTQDVSMTGDPRTGDDFKLRWTTALVNKLTEMLNMSVRYEFERNRATSADVPDTQRLITAIGCVF